MALPEPLPDLAALDLLVTVSELGSISAAAQAHGVSQPAASMRLRTLERALGLRLLDRARTGSQLTPAGLATTEWAVVVLRDVHALLAGTAALRQDRGSRLRVAASMTVAEYLLPDWLRRLGAADADVSVSLEMGNTARVNELVAHRRADLGFIEGPRPPGALRSRELLEDQLVVVVGRYHPWAKRRRPLTAAQVGTVPLLLREKGSGTREILEEALAEHGLEPRPAMELGSTTAIKSAAIAGTAPAVLSRLAVQNEIRAGQLIAVSTSGLRLSRTIRAVWPSGLALSPACNTLLQAATGPRSAPAR